MDLMASVAIRVTGEHAGDFIAALCPVVVTDPAGTPVSGRITLGRGLALHVTAEETPPADAHLHVLAATDTPADTAADVSVRLDPSVGETHSVDSAQPAILRIDPARRSHLAAALIACLSARLDLSAV